MKTLAVVVLNYNGKEHLQTFLPSVIHYAAPHEVIVIDNASTDESIALIQHDFPAVRCISLSTNFGFAKGYNEGLKTVIGQYEHYLILNSDVEVTEGFIPPLLERIAPPQIASVQPKIRSWKNKNTFEHAGASGGFIDKNGYPFCRGRIFNECEEDRGQYDNPIPVFWTSGACMLVKASVFHTLNGFDEDFEAHMEEIDWCWRAQHLGYEVWVEPKSVVYHLGGGTLSYQTPRKTYLNFRNNLFMLLKNTQGFWLGRLWIRMVWDGIAAFQYLIKGDFSLCYEVFKAHMSFYSGCRAMLKKRTTIKNKKVNGHYRGNIILAFYLRKKRNFSSIDL
jgi:GT2 family glycosyltransferase